MVDGASFTNSLSFGTVYGSRIGTATAQKIGFWNATPVTQPNQANVVTALRDCGLLAGGPSVSTFGVLPLSPRTLTTTASINFGSFGAHDTLYSNVVVTGAAVNDIVLLGLPSVVCQGLVYQGNVISANTVCVGASNTDNQAVDSTSQTFRITVIGY